MHFKIQRIFIPFVILGFFFSAFPAEDRAIDPQDSLKYRVSVNALVVPMFAVDKQNQPVFDLKKEDIQLTIAGKQVDFTMFSRHNFATQTVDQTKRPAQFQNRYIFIIIDTMFVSRTGFRRAKKIAARLLETGSKGDIFVIFENNPVKGLTLLAGPKLENKKKIWLVKQLKRGVGRWATQLFESRDMSNNVDFSIVTDFRLETEKLRQLWRNTLEMEREIYKHRLQDFSRSLSKFRYLLNTINLPKVVFLISEGTSRGAFKNKAESMVPNATASDTVTETGFESVIVQDEKTVMDQNEINSPYLYRYLTDIAKAVNYGGSVFYPINPGRLNDTNDENVMGEMSLRYLASESGGEYFTGSDPMEIVKKINRSTAAYYELVISLSGDMPVNMKVDIQCKRDNVSINSLNHIQKNHKYRLMAPMEKKVFAMNVVTGGSWSRMVCHVMKVPFKKDKTSSDNRHMTVLVPIPNQMKNRSLDMFQIDIDPVTEETEMNFVRREVTALAKIKVKTQTDKKQYLVFVEPRENYCIYTEAL